MTDKIIEKYREVKEVVGKWNESDKSNPEKFIEEMKEKTKELTEALENPEKEEKKEG